ncbi:MAG TPA: PTS system mannose/fructose/sorbose family transporter subunit IID [Gemmatimonadaceae bacterium]|nr:PTS system mannose/fructose/sorbose family transporter subunit IID [Gemmatimonadaceae bacterium]
MSASPAPAPPPAAKLPTGARIAMLLRMLAVQGSWNYELLLGPGIGFCAEPALRRLPGGRRGEAYREALARQARYFNAHPYLASLAVGALARAELDRVPPSQIERFRTALCGPLGSVGDRLVWAGWLPFCALLGLTVFGLGAPAWVVVVVFLVVYNTGHLALRVWGLRTGWQYGMKVASALGAPVLRRGPTYIARAGALLAGIALPLVLFREIGGNHLLLAATTVASLPIAALLVRLHGRIEGWRVALVALALLTLYSVTR